MTRVHEALLLAAILLGLAVLAVFEIIPAGVSQYAPLVMLPWIIRHEPRCAMPKI